MTSPRINPQQKQQNAPYQSTLFLKEERIKEIFNNQEYVQRDNQTDIFRFGADDFNIQQIYMHYYTKQKRYPIQAYLDVQFFNALQEYAKTKEERDQLSLKTRKVAQLAQKLFNLNMLEERLIARKRLIEMKKQYDERLKEQQIAQMSKVA